MPKSYAVRRKEKRAKRKTVEPTIPEPVPLPEFKMTIDEAVSYINARTCNIDYMIMGDYNRGGYIPREFYQVRRAINNRTFILNYSSGNKIELFIKVEGHTIQKIIEAFEGALSYESEERSILQKDLDAVKFIPKKYKP